MRGCVAVFKVVERFESFDFIFKFVISLRSEFGRIIFLCGFSFFISN